MFKVSVELYGDTGGRVGCVKVASVFYLRSEDTYSHTEGNQYLHQLLWMGFQKLQSHSSLWIFVALSASCSLFSALSISTSRLAIKTHTIRRFLDFITADSEGPVVFVSAPNWRCLTTRGRSHQTERLSWSINHYWTLPAMLPEMCWPQHNMSFILTLISFCLILFCLFVCLCLNLFLLCIHSSIVVSPARPVGKYPSFWFDPSCMPPPLHTHYCIWLLDNQFPLL